MFEKFTEGLKFGIGFAVAFILIWYICAYSLLPKLISSQFKNINKIPESIIKNDSDHLILPKATSDKKSFGLTVEEQIQKSSVIAIAHYTPAPDD